MDGAAIVIHGEPTIALTLERERLEHRPRRMELAVSALRDRAVFRESTIGVTPPALRQAIASFEDEIIAIRRRLTELAQPDPLAEDTRTERVGAR